MSVLEVSDDAGGGRNGGLVAIAMKELMNLKASLEYQIGEMDRCIGIVRGEKARAINRRDYLMQQIPNLKTEVERTKTELQAKLDAPEAEIENLRTWLQSHERKASDWEAELNALVQGNVAWRDARILALQGIKEVLQREESEVTERINGLVRRPEIRKGDSQMWMINLLKNLILGQERSTKRMCDNFYPRENGIRSRL